MEQEEATVVEPEAAEEGQEHEQLKERVMERQRQAAESGGTEDSAPPLQELQEEVTASSAATLGGEINLDALLDVQVNLSVEIGRSRMPIKSLISLNQGSVVELDRLVNEPLDLLVNGTLIARGEVVVVDGQFGLRLIDIVSQSERLKKLK